MLPDEVDGSCSIKQNGSDRADHCAKGGRQRHTLIGCRIQALGLERQHGKRNTNIRNGTDVRGDRSARGNEGDVDDLHGYTDKDTGLHVPQHKTAYQSADQRSSQSVVTQ